MIWSLVEVGVIPKPASILLSKLPSSAKIEDIFGQGVVQTKKEKLQVLIKTLDLQSCVDTRLFARGTFDVGKLWEAVN